MSRSIVIKAHLVGPNTVALDEPLPEGTAEVEVVVRLRDERPARTGLLSEYVMSLPPGTRTKEDIDQQLREERDSWS